MSAQRLNAKSVRRIERNVGLPVLRAWASGGYVMAFVTTDHRHGWWDKKTGELGWDESRLAHFNTCAEMFPGWDQSSDTP